MTATISYPGSKAGSGVYQAIINQIPPHTVYIEPFAGGAAIMRLKKRAPVANIAVDADAAALEMLRGAVPAVYQIHGDGIKYLVDCHHCTQPTTFVYCDPPYLLETRSGRKYYQHEMTDDQHVTLLLVLRELRCMVAISGYDHPLYNEMLTGWRKIQFPAMTRGGWQATETLWMNYPEPTQLHDYRYLGSDYRERERIKKKKNRWRSKLEHMEPLERYALLSTIQELWENE